MSSRLHLEAAVRTLAAGGVVAYPTEAVWGLGCEPLNAHACARILAIKHRARGKGFILIASDFEQVRPFVRDLPRAKLAPALETWPGPYTWLLPAAGGVPELLTGGRGTIAVRVTAHPVASALCAAYGSAIVSTSANLSGHRPARSALQLRTRLRGRVDEILPGETGGLAAPTPIRDLATGEVIRR